MFSRVFGEDQIGVPPQSGDDRTAGQRRDMVANLEAGAAPRVGYEGLVLGVEESILGHRVRGHEVEQGLRMGFRGHGEGPEGDGSELK